MLRSTWKTLKCLYSYNGRVNFSHLNNKLYCLPQQSKPKAEPEMQTPKEKSFEEQDAPKLYTKRGDKGLSYLCTGERRPKNDMIFEVLGETDELSCVIGLACEFTSDKIKDHKYLKQLEKVQCILQDIEAVISSPPKKIEFSPSHTKSLEEWIDEYATDISPQKNFILPSGGTTSAWLHVARTQCRTAERRLVAMKKIDEDSINDEVLRYYNRLGDYLLTVARVVAQIEEKQEKVYRSSLSQPLSKIK